MAKSWRRYYRRPVRSLIQEAQTVVRDYFQLVGQLYPGGWSLLGGFHPLSASGNVFVSLSRQAGLQPLLLDKNQTPLRDGICNGIGKIQANLKNLPLAPNSLALILLDSTTSFMATADLHAFAAGAEEALAPEGRLLILEKFSPVHRLFPQIKFPFRRESPRQDLAQTFPRRIEDLRAILEQHSLQLLDYLDYDPDALAWPNFAILVFANHQSQAVPFNGRQPRVVGENTWLRPQ